MVDVISNGDKFLLFGNGRSAGDSKYVAANLMGGIIPSIEKYNTIACFYTRYLFYKCLIKWNMLLLNIM